MSGKPEQTLFLTMDGMRGIGAVMVVVGHCLIFWGGLPMMTQLLPYLVDMFFLFSGFVIAYAFEPRIAAGMSPKGFMLQRLIRLAPVYFIGLAMGIAVYLVQRADDAFAPAVMVAEIAPQALMLPSLNFDRESIYTLNGPAWSLFFELWANLVYILIWRFLSLRVLIGVVLAFAMLTTAASYYFGDMHAGWGWHNFLGGFPRAGFGFFAGVLIYRVAGSPSAAPARRSPWAWLSLLSPIPLAIFIVPEPFKIPVQLAVAFIYGPAMIWLASQVQPSRFLSRLCMRAGAISYALYMLHYPVFEAMERLSWRMPALATDFGPAIGIAILALSVSLAWSAERFYERPLRRWIVRQLQARSVAHAKKTASRPAGDGAVPGFAE